MHSAVTGGAGFIGSNLVDRLMARGDRVTVLDNFSGGRREFLAQHLTSPRFTLRDVDVRDIEGLSRSLDSSVDVIYHLAANADIARGVDDPTLDFEHSLVATFSVLSVMRRHGLRRIVYTSGSGVYGDRGHEASSETQGPLLPVSMYGATKMGAEGLVSAFCHLFDIQAWILRPANIIGPRATHGVVFDFMRRLRRDPSALRMLGDGEQSKSYLHVADVIDILLDVQTQLHERVNIINIASDTAITVNDIADLVLEHMGLSATPIHRTGGKIGWLGDVPIVRLDCSKVLGLGWRPKYDSRAAVIATIQALLADERV